jgi:hypothetical protein
MRRRCIFCKLDSAGSRSAEHIIPESLGNIEHTLPAGTVCDRCNNYFASSIEQPILESGHLQTARFNMLIPNKRRRMPLLQGTLLPDVRTKGISEFHCAEVSRNKDGDYEMYLGPKAANAIRSGQITRVVIPATGDMPDRQKFSRFLSKVALECMAQRLLENAPEMVSDFIDDSQIDLIRNYARFGKSGLLWPFSERRIYSPDHTFKAGKQEPYEVLHEWTFLYTAKLEMYFVLAILGIEYVINMGGPDIEGYGQWLQENGQRSPLYPGSDGHSGHTPDPQR